MKTLINSQKRQETQQHYYYNEKINTIAIYLSSSACTIHTRFIVFVGQAQLYNPVSCLYHIAYTYIYTHITNALYIETILGNVKVTTVVVQWNSHCNQ